MSDEYLGSERHRCIFVWPDALKGLGRTDQSPDRQVGTDVEIDGGQTVRHLCATNLDP
jgi:hypothetical protein